MLSKGLIDKPLRIMGIRVGSKLPRPAGRAQLQAARDKELEDFKDQGLPHHILKRGTHSKLMMRHNFPKINHVISPEA